MRSNLFSFKLLYSHYLTKFHQEHVQSWHKLGHPPCHICVPCKMIWIHEWWKSQWENIVTVDRLIHFWLICFIFSLSLALSPTMRAPNLSAQTEPGSKPKCSTHHSKVIWSPRIPNYRAYLWARNWHEAVQRAGQVWESQHSNPISATCLLGDPGPFTQSYCASASSTVKWYKNMYLFAGHCEG